MGCCFSSTAGSNAPYPNDNTASPSSHAINDPRPPPPSSQWTTGQPSGPGDHSSPASPITSRAPSVHRLSHQSQRQTVSRQAERSSRPEPETEPHNPPQPQAPSASPTPTVPSRPSGRTSAFLSSPSSSQLEPVDEPLQRFKWRATNERPWSREQLDKERQEFFDTRVTGRPEVWQALRLAMESLWEADIRKAQRRRRRSRRQFSSSGSARGEQPDDGNTDNGVAAAQAILYAAEVTLPTGNLSDGVYDSLGNLYYLPEWVICDPVNLSASLPPTGGDHDATVEEKDEDDEQRALRRREEKGKAVMDVNKLIKIRVRLSDTGQDVTIKVSLDDSCRSVARSIAEDCRLPPSKSIRLAYMGRLLKEALPLEAQGWQRGHVLGAYIFDD